MATDCGRITASPEYAGFIYGGFSPAASVCDAVLNNQQRVFYLPLAQAQTQGLLAYGYNALPKLYGLMDEAAMERSGILTLQDQRVLPLRGKNVLIGILDTGIDYDHPAFMDEKGTTRVIRIWDQTLEGEPPVNGPFYYGSEFAKEQLLEGVPTRDEIGHGTRLAMLAAGRAVGGTSFSGAAPEAELVVVKLKPAKEYLREWYLVSEEAVAFAEDDILLGLSYLVRVADELGRPMVVIFGMGTTQADHDRGGELGFLMGRLGSYDGIAIACAAGNEGGRRHHASVTVTGEYEDLELRVEPEVGFNTMSFSFPIWGRAIGEFSLSVMAPNGEVSYIQPMIYGRENAVNFALLPTRIQIFFEPVYDDAVRQMAFIRVENAAAGIWKWRIYRKSRQLTVDAWLPLTSFLHGTLEFLTPDPKHTVTDPGNQKGVITAGAYDIRSDTVWIHSGRGPAAEQRTKPDLAAPGVDVNVLRLLTVPGEQSLQRVTGTSYAAAILGGAAALMLEWGLIYGYFPRMNTAQIKNLLIRGARLRPNLNVPDELWGYGALEVYQALVGAGLRGEVNPILPG